MPKSAGERACERIRRNAHCDSVRSRQFGRESVARRYNNRQRPRPERVREAPRVNWNFASERKRHRGIRGDKSDWMSALARFHSKKPLERGARKRIAATRIKSLVWINDHLAGAKSCDTIGKPKHRRGGVARLVRAAR